GDDFALLPVTLAEGRAILHNLRRAAKLFLVKNVYSLFLIVVGLGFLGLEFPYLPQQVTLLNTLTIGVPALLIMFDKPGRHRPVRGIFREVGLFALAAGLIVGSAALTVWLLSRRSMIDDEQTPRTLVLSTLILTGLGNVMVVSERDVRVCLWVAVSL